ncbi:MAG TPA: AI-2E family transporter [Candidatus Nanoarchaeia archaeon]|nr:AI-2E family transporter [Candidatus Nanoarchaeia archaeon]
MDKSYWRHITSTLILVVLIGLSFFLLKPILLSIITGIILAFLFRPVYNYLTKKGLHKNLSATIVSVVLVLLVVVPLWFVIPVLIDQSIQIFISSQSIDFVTPLKNLFPSAFSYDVFTDQIGTTISSFITKITGSVMTGLADLISNFPTIFLKTLVVLFIFFFTLRDNEKFIEYIQSILPFSKEIEKKLFKSSRDITSSILYGQIIIGIIQGVFVGIGFFLFGLDNALFLTLAACLAGIFPIIGTAIIWIPVVIFLFAGGLAIPALGIILFGFVSTFLENAIKPTFVAKRTNVHSSVILLGMVGGLFVFGILGFILGPLILSYLLIILEIYRDKRSPGIFIHSPKKA